MRILHCCLAAFYIDEYGYQENVLPRMHKSQGHEVAIIASTETYIDNRTLGYVEPRSYQTESGIPIERIPYHRMLPSRLARKLRIYEGLLRAVADFSPDIIFLHDCQFLGIREIARYAKANPDVRIYVDGHTDFVNSARNWISKHVLHAMIYRYCAQLIEPYTRKFWGVLPSRVQFLEEMYGIPAEKTGLLVLGAEDSKVASGRQSNVRSTIRQELGIGGNDFVVLAGGKIDRRKRFSELMRAVARMDRPNLKLILFGVADHEMEAEISELAKHPRISSVGWVESDRTYDYLLAADLAVFPGTHSVLWEQAVGVGLPCVFREWPGMKHVDIGGNCLFIEEGTISDIENVVARIIDDAFLYDRMKKVAVHSGIPEFSYSEIAKRAIEA